jgi:hypothetical protein
VDKMKNQYFGDINDYRKYGLIRLLAGAGEIRTGICWMLTPDDTRTDGKFIEYLDKPKKYKDFDPDLYEFLSQCIRENARDVLEVKKSDIFPNTNFYDPILKDDAVRRKQYFSNMYKLFQDVDLIFFDPDNGLEVKSKSLGHKNSSKYLYWSEVAECYKKGHSILIYQHFIREDRNEFISRILENIHTKTGSENTIYFQSSSVVFFLICQDKYSQYFLNKSRLIFHKWGGQIQVFSQIKDQVTNDIAELIDKFVESLKERSLGFTDEQLKNMPTKDRFQLEEKLKEAEIPKSWSDYILISLGLKKKKGGQPRDEEIELQIARDILKWELKLQKEKPTISEKEVVDSWLEENEDEDGNHQKYRIGTPNRYLEIYRKRRATAMGEIVGKGTIRNLKRRNKPQK